MFRLQDANEESLNVAWCWNSSAGRTSVVLIEMLGIVRKTGQNVADTITDIWQTHNRHDNRHDNYITDMTNT